MSALYPHSAADVAFAPVLLGLESNLQILRSCADLEFALALELNDDDHWYQTPMERADRIRRSACRLVELHGLTVTPTADGYGLKVSHGEYSVPIMFGKRLADYVEHGLSSARFNAQAA